MRNQMKNDSYWIYNLDEPHHFDELKTVMINISNAVDALNN